MRGFCHFVRVCELYQLMCRLHILLRMHAFPQLATMHPLLATRLPFMGTTSLLQAAWLQQSFFPGPDSAESVGVVTFKKSALVSNKIR